MNTQISVVIVTRNRHQKLFQVLTALSRSTFTNFEVIVVDQSNTNSVNTKFLRFKKVFQRFRYHHSTLRGKSRGLNEAISFCRSPIVAFTDDDCVPDSHWLQSFFDCFKKDAEVCGVFGQTKAYHPEKHLGLFCPSTFSNKNPLPHKIKKPVLPSKEIGIGNNMAFKKSFFETMGPFKEWLGPGSVGSNGEDSEIALRAVSAGKVLFYEPKAIIFHNRWLTLKELFTQDLSYLCGEFACYQYYALKGSAFAQKFLNQELSQEFSREVKEFVAQFTQLKKFSLTLLFWLILKLIARARGRIIGTIFYIAS